MVLSLPQQHRAWHIESVGQILFYLSNDFDWESIELGNRKTSSVKHEHSKVVVVRYLGLSQGRKQLKKEAIISVKCK